jgi:hypothetical protein
VIAGKQIVHALVLLTLSGWTSPQIAEAFGVREDTVRLWRSDFSRSGVDALTASVAPGPPPVKSETALRVAPPLLEEPVAQQEKLDDRPLARGARNSTISNRSGAISKRITSRIKPSPMLQHSTRPSAPPSETSTASAWPFRWPSYESLLR